MARCALLLTLIESTGRIQRYIMLQIRGQVIAGAEPVIKVALAELMLPTLVECQQRQHQSINQDL
jgi:hypothetical protein